MITAWIGSLGKIFVFLVAAANTKSAVALAYSSDTSGCWSKTNLSSRSPLLIPNASTAAPPTESTTSSSSSVVHLQQLVPRAAFLRSIAFGGTALLLGTPTSSTATSIPSQDNNPSAKFQAGLADLDRAVSKEAKKIDRAVTKEKKNISKEIRKETKKIDKSTKKATKVIRKEVKKIDKKTQKATKEVKKETKKVMRGVDKETEKVRREAKKIGSGLEQKANALVGGNSDVVPQARSGGGIDVSKLKVCDESKEKCLR